MSDFFTTAVAMQQEILRAQQAQLDAAKAQLAAAQTLLDAGQQAGEQVAAVQDAATKAVEANTRAWVAWASLWGWL